MRGEVIKMKKRRINSEILYLIAILVLSFSIDLLTIANMGLSAINGPAYILSEKVYSLTYGQAEYIVEWDYFLSIFCYFNEKFKIDIFEFFYHRCFICNNGRYLENNYSFLSNSK